jgi:hypothetical protein
MSAANPAPNQVRRNVAAAPSRAPQPQAHAQAHAPVRQPAPVARANDFSVPRDEGEIQLNLSDLPRMSTGDLDVEGFKPSLLSRLFDLVSPLGRR